MALDPIFHALNRYTCQEVLNILRDGAKPVSEIHARVKIGSRPNVSQALALLFEARLVDRRRVGRQNHYELRSAGWKELFNYTNKFLKLTDE
jgi:DNA-binding transcriptional ArsR family regulator